MSNLLRFLSPSLCLVLALAGCGSSPNATPSNTAPEPFNATGNWEFEVQLAAQSPSGPIVFPTNPIEDIFGTLSSSGKSVSAVLHAAPLNIPHCVEMDTDLPFTGTTDSSGNLTLTAPLAGGVATIAANLITPQTITLPDGTVRNEPFYSGTYQVVGGTCAQPSISLAISPVANITGTYTGTATPIPSSSSGPSSTITASLVEASAPDTNGKYALTGTITSTGGCNATYSFSSGAVSGDIAESSYVLSNTFSSAPNSPYPQPPVFFGYATLGTSRPTIFGIFTFPGCTSSINYQGALNPTQ